MIKRVLVTGATGFIGRHVVKRLRDEGLTVYGLSRKGGTVNEVAVESVDLADNVQLQKWQQRKTFEAIIHLASAIPDSIKSLETLQCFRTNVSGMINILALAQAMNCPLIYTSSSSVYGTVNDSQPVSEETLPKPDNYYSSSKYVGDILCEQIRLTHNIPITTLRISAPYGPGNFRGTVVNIFLQAALRSESLILHGTGSRVQDFTYIDDVIEAIWMALQNLGGGIFNIASGSPVSMKTLAETVLKIVPSTSSQIVYSGRSDPQENYRANFSIEKARHLLGWKPEVSLSDGLRHTAKFLLQEDLC